MATKTPIYNTLAQEDGTLLLPPEIFEQPWNADLVQQVMLSMRSNKRAGTAHTKDRGEVSGGGRKPWQQKGTGRARHGSSRSPIWSGGGVTHGPNKNKNYDRKINKKTANKALYAVLSQKLRDSELLFVSGILSIPEKTKEGALVLKRLGGISGFSKIAWKKGNRVLIALPRHNAPTVRLFRNIPSVEVIEARNLNPLKVLEYQHILFAEPKESVAELSLRAGSKKTT